MGGFRIFGPRQVGDLQESRYSSFPRDVLLRFLLRNHEKVQAQTTLNLVPLQKITIFALS